MSDMVSDYTLRPFSVDEYHRMAEAGVLDAEERVELCLLYTSPSPRD